MTSGLIRGRVVGDVSQVKVLADVVVSVAARVGSYPGKPHQNYKGNLMHVYIINSGFGSEICW